MTPPRITPSTDMSTKLPIITIPTESLRKRSVEVDPKEITTPEFQAWLDDLVATMYVADGVGIAAPQTGKNVRVFVAVDDKTPHILINPVLKKKSFRRVDGEEGCLSVPGKYGIVSRHRSVRMEALDREGNQVTFNVKGFFARVLQHELDHLDGVLFIDRAKKVVDIAL